MKFKMAPNSLFAVLLRKPWWISLAIAAALGLVAMALLPDDLRGVGAMSGFPFAIISAIALKRQWNAPGAREVQAAAEAAASLAWPEFCRLLEQAFAREGGSVTRVQGAADLLVERGTRKTLVAARRWKAARHGEEALQALLDALPAHEADDAVYVALGALSPNAQRLARQHGIRLVQDEALALLLRGLLKPAR